PPGLVIYHEGFFREIALADTVCSNFCCKPAGEHRVVDTSAGQGVDDPCGISGNEETVAHCTVKRSADRDPPGDILDGLSLREGLFHEPVKVVLCPVSCPALPAGDTDPDICCTRSLGEYPEVPLRRDI